MTTFESEASIEEKLIQQLVEGKSQWTFRGDIHTFDDLWNNFRKILIQNNKEIFDEHPLTDSEFQQVQNHLRFPTFYDAAQCSWEKTESSGSASSGKMPNWGRSTPSYSRGPTLLAALRSMKWSIKSNSTGRKR